MNYNPYCKISSKTNTVPNQSLSVKQILERFTRGQSLPVGRVSVDDPQGLSDDEHMQLHQVEDEFERLDILNRIEEGNFINSRRSSDSEAERSEAKSSERRRESKNDPNKDSKSLDSENSEN